MANKNKIPKIRFKGFEEEWKTLSFSETFLYLQNNTLSRADLNYNSGNSKNIHYGDILVKFGEILDVKNTILPYISDDAIYEKYKHSKLQDGDVIIADAAEDKTVGKCTELLKVDDENIISGLHTIAIRPIFTFSFGFLGYYMNSLAYHNQLIKLMQGIKVLSISKTALQNTTIVYPSKEEEQTRIGKFFEQTDKLISLREKKISKLQWLKKAMLQKMFPAAGSHKPQIRFKGFTEDWKVKELGEVGYTYTGLSGKTKEDFGHGKGQFVTYMNVFSNAITNPQILDSVEVDEKQNEVMKGDVFFTTSSETPEEVGMASVWLGEGKNIYLNSFCFGFRPNIEFDNYYLAYLLRSSAIRKEITFLAQGISRYNISKTKVMEISVPVPDIKEQQKIGDYFKHLDKLISLHRKEISKLETIKKASLENMFV